MAHSLKGLDQSEQKFDGKGMRVAIVHTRWNQTVVQALVKGCKDALTSNGVAEDDVLMHVVPGSYELPFAARGIVERARAEGKRIDAVVCVGVLIKGSTMHFEYICEAVTQGITNTGLETGVPIIFGVLTCLNETQALERAGLTPNGHNHGTDWGTAAIEMSKYRFGAGAANSFSATASSSLAASSSSSSSSSSESSSSSVAARGRLAVIGGLAVVGLALMKALGVGGARK